MNKLKTSEEKLLKLLTTNEDEIIEYKVNNTDHERIGKYISALANSSALLNRQFSYMIWGIEDETKEIIGTKFYPKTQKINGGEPFISWLEKLLDPRITITFEEYEIKGKRYIRSGSSLKNLSDYPEKEREL